MKIEIENRVYNVHPIFDLYACSKDGHVINIIKRVPMKGNICHSGYLNCMVRKHGQSGQKNYQVHRFVFECFNGIIPDAKVIDHTNNNKEDNRLCNLQLMTQQQNCKKTVKFRDLSNNHKNRKCVKATNKNTNEVTYFNSTYAVKQHLSINHVWNICENHGCKSGKSKKDGCYYTFQYIKEEDLPENHIKSSNIRPRKVSDEDKIKHKREWWNKEYKCPKCSIVIKNNSKYKHIKKCLT